MIKIIAFDLGGVYFEYGTGLILPEIYKLTDVPKEEVDNTFNSYPKGGPGWLIRTGKITSEEFWKIVIERLRIDKKLVSKIREMWYSSYKPIKGMKEFVSALRKNYKVFVFSGNCKERVEYFNRKYGLMHDFDGFIFSFNAGANKKEIEFYEFFLNKIKCKPEECIFIDDKQEFLDIAETFGIKTILFKNIEQLKNDLNGFGVKIQ